VFLDILSEKPEKGAVLLKKCKRLEFKVKKLILELKMIFLG